MDHVNIFIFIIVLGDMWPWSYSSVHITTPQRPPKVVSEELVQYNNNKTQILVYHYCKKLAMPIIHQFLVSIKVIHEQLLISLR